MATIDLVAEFDQEDPKNKKKKSTSKVAVKNTNPDFLSIKDKEELYSHMYVKHANYYKSQSLADKMSSDRKILGVPIKKQSNLEKILTDKSNKNWGDIEKIRNNPNYNEKDYFNFRDKKDNIPDKLTYTGSDGAGNVRKITLYPYDKTDNYIPYTTDVGTKGVLEYPVYEKVRRQYILKNKK